MKIPFIAIKNQIILPFGIENEKIRVGKPASVNAFFESVEKHNNKVLIAFIKKDVDIKNEPNINQLEEYGVIADIVGQEENNGIYDLQLKSGDRQKIISLEAKESADGSGSHIIYANTEEDILENKNLKNFNEKFRKVSMIVRKLAAPHFDPTEDGMKTNGNFKAISNFLNSYKNDINVADYSLITWKIINHLRSSFSTIELLKFINYSNLDIRFDEIIKKLINRIKFDELEGEINSNLRGDMENQQREFFLREKLRQINKMLNEDDGGNKLVANIEENDALKKQYPQYVLDALRSEQNRMSSMMPSSPEANISKTYIDLLLNLPWRKVSKEIIDIDFVRKILDRDHYGLKKPKERILEFISVLTHTKGKSSKDEYIAIKNDPEHFIDTKLFVTQAGQANNNPVNNIPILTLIGPPGTGKTTLAKSIAEALKRKFIKVSLGGVKDESEIRGHRRTYVGAMPGKIISAIKKARVSNPVILLDEIDKMSSDFRGDPTSAMLEVLDPEQNANFQDHYLDLEYDLSKVLFIATANSYDTIPAPLIDRVEILELSTYTTKEKIEIAKSYLMPKIYSQNALTEKQMQLNDEVLEFIVRFYTRESGVRELKRILDSIARKIVVQILDKKIKKEFIVTKQAVVDFLGPIKFDDDENENKAQIGVVNGLAYTSFGGSTLAIEVTTFPGKDGLKLTGQLKDVMKESAQIALAYVRSNAKKFGIDFDFENNSIHIHVPAGAIPKDGPSAGVTFTTSIISALTKKPVPAIIGMTGEITLRGKVLPIGGLKEKSLAATQFGIKKIFIPNDNFKNLVDVPEEVKKEVQFIPVKYYDEIYNEIFK
ncbi:endopeptidase La [Mycoplasma phocoeninasale]|uniref:Lon protease n=1 Tax=Mycoplasma phocoeninasale TaxID=2726117 RepID=A0A858U329_9MOLU|nr:endopeptidase La [Mycoplasma phocoeninasale]QJG66449.1 endopeptidase La [Mycoplasma phocoeninasale]